MTRLVPTQFAGETSDTTTNLDADFQSLVPGNVLPCTATGTNTIALTPVVGSLSVSAYTDKEQYSFNAPNATTGSVTINVSAVGALKAFKAGGITQLGNGDITSGQFCQFAYQASLDTGAGGFVLVSAVPPAAGGVTVTTKQMRFISTGTFSAPGNTALSTVFKFTVTGGGGGGAAAGAVPIGGGGAGATAIHWQSGITPSQQITITVGSGGAAVAQVNAGNSGIASSVVIGALTVTAGPGNGGNTVGNLPAGRGGVATSAVLNIAGGDGGGNTQTGDGGGHGGSSFWGGGSQGATTTSANPAVAPGSGGGACNSTGSGGAGADGIALVEWVA
jgi:glycine rich protein